MNPRDVTQVLRRAIEASSEWSPSSAAEVLDCLRESLSIARVDWDRGAGEAWGRLLHEDQPVVALNALVPIALVRVPVDSKVLDILNRKGVVAIMSSDWEQHELKADPEIVKQAFRRREWSPSVDPEAFSASELWWMTI